MAVRESEDVDVEVSETVQGYSSKLAVDGFAIYRGMFSASELAPVVERMRAERLGQSEKFVTNDVANKVPEVRSFIWEPRVVGFVGECLGGSPKFLQASDFQINHNVPTWHRDSPSRKFGGADWDSRLGRYTCVKAIVYLESTEFAFGVVPGSHLSPLPVRRVLEYDGEPIVVGGSERPGQFGFDSERWRPVKLHVNTGDVVVFDQRLFHRGWPLHSRPSHQDVRIRGRGINKYCSGKVTLALCYGLENLHSSRYYAAFRYHRRDLQYGDLDDLTVRELERHDLLLETTNVNPLETDPALRGDMYSTYKLKKAKQRSSSDGNLYRKPRERSPSDGRVKKAAAGRPFLRFQRPRCPACGTREQPFTSHYPSLDQSFFANLCVLGCDRCGFCYVPNRLLDVEPFRADALLASLPSHHGTHGDALTLTGGGATLELVCSLHQAARECEPARQRICTDDLDALHRLPDASVHALVADRCLEHVHATDVLPLLRLVVSKLAPNARFVVRATNASLLRLNTKAVQHSPCVSFLSARSLVHFLERAGLKVDGVRGHGKSFAKHGRPRYEPCRKWDFRERLLLAYGHL